MSNYLELKVHVSWSAEWFDVLRREMENAGIGDQLAVDTLFIDEGFGTLSGEPLQNAINTLRSLHSSMGRQVGIISHVKDLREKIPVKIMVDREGHSSFSTVKVVPGV